MLGALTTAELRLGQFLLPSPLTSLPSLTAAGQEPTYTQVQTSLPPSASLSPPPGTAVITTTTTIYNTKCIETKMVTNQSRNMLI